MRTWRGHADFFNCDKQEKEAEKSKKRSKRKKMEEERERKQVAMKRYLQYRERFEHHEGEQKGEAELKTSAAAKMQQLQDAYSTKPEVQFIDKAVNELLECRNVMKYTYVFSYYCFPLDEKSSGAAKHLFEMLQLELEKTTDRLHEVVESLLKRTDSEMMQLKVYTTSSQISRSLIFSCSLRQLTTQIWPARGERTCYTP